MQQHCSKCLPTDPPPTLGMGSIGQKSTFSQHCQANNLPAPPPPLTLGQKAKIQLFQNDVMLHIQLKGITNAATW